MTKHTFRPQLEVLEDRLTPSGNPNPLAPNPGDPQAVHSGNLVAVDSSQVIHNGGVVSQQAQTAPGFRAEQVQILLGHS
jgi:hypothetical protein